MSQFIMYSTSEHDGPAKSRWHSTLIRIYFQQYNKNASGDVRLYGVAYILYKVYTIALFNLVVPTCSVH